MDPPNILIRRRLRELRISQGAIADVIGKSQGWVSQYLLGETGTAIRRLWVEDPEALERLAAALDWSVGEFMSITQSHLPGFRGQPREGDDVVLTSSKVIGDLQEVKIYREGTGPTWTESEVLEIGYVPKRWGDNLIGIQVDCSHMEPYVTRNQVVLVSCDGFKNGEQGCEPGSVCAVYIPDKGVTIRRLLGHSPDGLLQLETLNPGPNNPRVWYAPDGSRIIGKVIKRVMDG